jgi:hypothetical protein
MKKKNDNDNCCGKPIKINDPVRKKSTIIKKKKKK